MSDAFELEAQARERVGKGAARELRRNKMVPAVIYGDKKDPLPIALPSKELTMKIHGGGFMTTLANIKVGSDTHKVLAKDIQFDPVRDFVTHVDFLRVSSKTIVTVEVPVNFVNEDASVGLTRGGVLNIVRHTVEVNCPASDIPESFEVDLSDFDLGDSINISIVTLPDGVVPTITDRDFTIATIASPAGLKSDEDEAEGDEEVAADEVPTTGDEAGEAEQEE